MTHKEYALPIHPFLALWLASLVAFIAVAFLVPGTIEQPLLTWAVIVAATWAYPHLLATRVQTMSSAVGYAIGIGALLGALVNLSAVIIYIAFFVTRGPDAAHISFLESVSMISYVGQLVFAPFWGALLGVLGGLIGGSTIPRQAA